MNTYEPDSPIIDDTDAISKSTATKIKETVKAYIECCNNKDYEGAYSCLTDDCKRYVYNNDIENFKTYVDNVFATQKTYSLQNYSNLNKVYVYNLTIIDDMEATGTTGSDNGEGSYDKYQEKIALTKVDGEFKIANDNFIQTVELGYTSEDDFMKITIESKDVSYSLEGYNLTIQNKTNGYIILSDYTVNDEVQLNVGGELRKALNLANSQFYVGPGETREISFIFRKYFDSSRTPTELRLNAIRLLKTFEGTEDTTQSAVKVYSMNISLDD